MLKRIISTIVGLGILAFVLVQKNQFIFNLAVAVISNIALWEFYAAVKKKGLKPISFIGYLSTIVLLGIGYLSKDILIMIVLLMLPLLLFIAFCTSILTNIKYDVFDISITLMGILYITYLFSFICYTKVMPYGDYLIWFIFGGAWITDTFAYLVGMAIGKHKFSKISPKKSIEGCIGGVTGCIAFFLIYTYFLNNNIDGLEINYILIGSLGFLVSIVSQIGDFAASSIKRFCEIKDYSEIMPGHGGILDRFDSILLISPLVYACLTLLNMGIL
ncbi:MAG: phosphatidate cytidylyltransferase [Clostridia bacterium]|nr:phosphatidate cytidylyltransferase [Clostridia bacterium]MBP3338068.1 phosphatidate cytidylyltransferase [Lachnospiraceae bacterium]